MPIPHFAGAPGGTSPGTPLLVTPSDTIDYIDSKGKGVIGRGLIIGTDGAISIETLHNGTVVLPLGSLAENIVHPIASTRINATGTTATNIIIVY